MSAEPVALEVLPDPDEGGPDVPPIESEEPVAELVLDGSATERRRLLLALQGEIDATYTVELLRSGEGFASYVITPETEGSA